MYTKLILLLVVASSLGACASRPQHIEGRPMSATSFMDLECDAISREVFSAVEGVQSSLDEVNRLADENHVRNTVWWAATPVTLVEPYDNGDSDLARRLEYLKGKYLAAQQAAQFHRCDQVSIRPLAYYVPARYQSTDDADPYRPTLLNQYSTKVLDYYDASERPADVKFLEAIERLDSYYKLDMVSNQEYRYTIGLLLERHLS